MISLSRLLSNKPILFFEFRFCSNRTSNQPATSLHLEFILVAAHTVSVLSCPLAALDPAGLVLNMLNI